MTSTPLTKAKHRIGQKQEKKQKRGRNNNQSVDIISDDELDIKFSEVLREIPSFTNPDVTFSPDSGSSTMIANEDGQPKKEDNTIKARSLKRTRSESCSTNDSVIILPTPAPVIIEIDSDDNSSESSSDSDEDGEIKDQTLVPVTSPENLFFEDRQSSGAILPIPQYSLVSDVSLAFTEDSVVTPRRTKNHDTRGKKRHRKRDDTIEEGEITTDSTIQAENTIRSPLKPIKPAQSKQSKKQPRMDDSVMFVSEQKSAPNQKSAPKRKSPPVQFVSKKPVDFISIVDSDDGGKQGSSKRKQKKKKTSHPGEEAREKRLVILDGNNIAIHHSVGARQFSVEGLKLAIDYFKAMGYQVKAVVPQYRARLNKSSNQKLLETLYNEGHILWSPCKNLPGNMSASYDDR